jgi:type III secretion protein L
MNGRIIKAGLPSSDMGAAAGAGAARVFKREVYDATLEAKNLVDAAEQRAKSIVQEAEAQRDRIVEAARDEGYSSGLAQWNQALAAAAASRENLAASHESHLVRLAVRIAEKIIGEELKTHPETIVSIVRESLQSVRQERLLTIQVNPESLDEVRRRVTRLKEVVGADREIHVVADPAVSLGGCIVESELGVIDARLETQLKCLEEALLRSARK